jgi:preprotein translocase subunit SecG
MVVGLVLVLSAFFSAVLIFAVLIQNPKGSGIDSTMGGSAASQMLGASQSADFIEKATWTLAGGIALFALVASYMLAPVKAATPTAPKAPAGGEKPAPAPKPTGYLPADTFILKG